MDISALMHVLQLGDSMLPVGAFSFSNGLESAVQVGLVADADNLRDYVVSACRQSAGIDGVALLEAHRATGVSDIKRIIRADEALLQRKLNEESRMMSVRMGKKLAEMSGSVFDAPLLATWLQQIKSGSTPGNYAVAQGVLFSELGLPETAAFAVHQYGIAAMILGAALRLMRIDHIDTQRILREVNELAAGDFQWVAEMSLDEMAGFAPALDVLSSVHVKAHMRMFMN